MIRAVLRAVIVAAAVLTAHPARADDAPAPAPVPAPAAPPAKREPTAGDLASARSALKEGLALREQGDLAGALPRFATAWDLVPTPITGFELGKTHMMMGHVLTASEMFRRVVRLPSSLEESQRSEKARAESATLANELVPRIPSLRLKLTLPPGATAVVKVDDEVLNTTGVETTRFVDPGAHDVIAKAGDGPEQTIHVDVAESEVKDVVLSPQWIAPKPAAVTTKGGQVVYVQTTNPLAFVGFGFAAAGVLMIGISTFVFLDAKGDADAHCSGNYCPPGETIGLPPNAVLDKKYEGIRQRYNGGIVGIIAGTITTVVFGAVGTVAATRPVKERIVSSLRPVVSHDSVGVVGAF